MAKIKENSDLLKKFAVKSQKREIITGNLSVIYNRCSTEKQDSLEWQDNVCKAFNTQLQFELLRCFGEKESATTDDREAFQEMLEFCYKNEVTNIITYSYDRFSRTGDLELIKKLRRDGITVHAATQKVDDTTTSGRFTQSLYLLFASMENDQRREKVMEGLKNKLQHGEIISTPPIGYEKRYVTGKKEHDHDKKQSFINEKGKLIKQAFLWKSEENLSHVEIIDRLKNMGLILSSPQLSRIFRNIFYCGYITNKLLKDEELIRGKHEPLITEEIFLKVNGLLNENPHGWTMKKDNEEMPLKTLVKCGICHSPLTAYPQKGIYIYYKCPNPGCCVNISNKRLHTLFSDKLRQFAINPGAAPVLKEQLIATYWKLHDSEVAREKPLRDELTRLRNELEAMELNFATSKLPFELYQKYSASHKQRITDSQAELEILIRDTSNLQKYLQSAIENSNNLLNIWQLLNCKGKRRLQNLIFPDGMEYFKENGQLRTQKINPIFSAITSMSSALEENANPATEQENEILRSVYSMFPSSNFFWTELEDAATTLISLSEDYPSIWKSFKYNQIDPLSGAIESVEYTYISHFTGTTQNVIQLPFTGVTTSYTTIPNLQFSGNSRAFLDFSGQT